MDFWKLGSWCSSGESEDVEDVQDDRSTRSKPSVHTEHRVGSSVVKQPVIERQSRLKERTFRQIPVPKKNSTSTNGDHQINDREMQQKPTKRRFLKHSLNAMEENQKKKGSIQSESWERRSFSSLQSSRDSERSEKSFSNDSDTGMSNFRKKPIISAFMKKVKKVKYDNNARKYYDSWEQSEEILPTSKYSIWQDATVTLTDIYKESNKNLTDPAQSNTKETEGFEQKRDRFQSENPERQPTNCTQWRPETIANGYGIQSYQPYHPQGVDQWTYGTIPNYVNGVNMNSLGTFPYYLDPRAGIQPYPSYQPYSVNLNALGTIPNYLDPGVFIQPCSSCQPNCLNLQALGTNPNYLEPPVFIQPCSSCQANGVNLDSLGTIPNYFDPRANIQPWSSCQANGVNLESFGTIPNSFDPRANIQSWSSEQLSSTNAWKWETIPTYLDARYVQPHCSSCSPNAPKTVQGLNTRNKKRTMVKNVKEVKKNASSNEDGKVCDSDWSECEEIFPTFNYTSPRWQYVRIVTPSDTDTQTDNILYNPFQKNTPSSAIQTDHRKSSVKPVKEKKEGSNSDDNMTKKQIDARNLRVKTKQFLKYREEKMENKNLDHERERDNSNPKLKALDKERKEKVKKEFEQEEMRKREIKQSAIINQRQGEEGNNTKPVQDISGVGLQKLKIKQEQEQLSRSKESKGSGQNLIKRDDGIQKKSKSKENSNNEDEKRLKDPVKSIQKQSTCRKRTSDIDQDRPNISHESQKMADKDGEESVGDPSCRNEPVEVANQVRNKEYNHRSKDIQSITVDSKEDIKDSDSESSSEERPALTKAARRLKAFKKKLRLERKCLEKQGAEKEEKIETSTLEEIVNENVKPVKNDEDSESTPKNVIANSDCRFNLFNTLKSKRVLESKDSALALDDGVPADRPNDPSKLKPMITGVNNKAEQKCVSSSNEHDLKSSNSAAEGSAAAVKKHATFNWDTDSSSVIDWGDESSFDEDDRSSENDESTSKDDDDGDNNDFGPEASKSQLVNSQLTALEINKESRNSHFDHVTENNTDKKANKKAEKAAEKSAKEEAKKAKKEEKAAKKELRKKIKAFEKEQDKRWKLEDKEERKQKKEMKKREKEAKKEAKKQMEKEKKESKIELKKRKKSGIEDIGEETKDGKEGLQEEMENMKDEKRQKELEKKTKKEEKKNEKSAKKEEKKQKELEKMEEKKLKKEEKKMEKAAKKEEKKAKKEQEKGKTNKNEEVTLVRRFDSDLELDGEENRKKGKGKLWKRWNILSKGSKGKRKVDVDPVNN